MMSRTFRLALPAILLPRDLLPWGMFLSREQGP